MGKRKAADFLLDMVTHMEAEGKSGSYIANNVKPVKNWLAFHGIQINQEIRISNCSELTTVADERTPVQDELRKILNAGTLRQKVVHLSWRFLACGLNRSATFSAKMD